MQAPASALPREITEGPLQALITVTGNPIGRLPEPQQTQEALQSLDLLICIGHQEDETAKHAHWVLPETFAWEQAALSLETRGPDSAPSVDWTSPRQTASENARPAEKILSDIYGALRPGMRGSVWGRHLGLFAQYVARADLEQWEQKFLSEKLHDAPNRWDHMVHDSNKWSPNGAGGVTSGGSYLHIGDADRSLWRPSTPNKRLELLSPEIVKMINKLSTGAAPTLVLRTGQWRRDSTEAEGQAPPPECLTVHLHPDLNLDEGSQVRITTTHGHCDATVRLDERLRNDVIDIPFYPGAASLQLLGTLDGEDLFGAIIMDGLEVKISPS